MRAFAVVGPRDAGRRALVEDLAERFSERGPVGTALQRNDPDDLADAPAVAGADRTYSAGDGGWIATGDSLSVEDALDELAPDCDYAIVEGAEGTSLPAVVVGDAEPESIDGPVLASAPSADEVDLDAVADALVDVEPYVTLESLVERIKDAPGTERSGAIATFTGRVRAKDAPDDEPTEYLEFERYDEVAAEKTEAIRQELRDREGVYEVLLHHKTGVVEAGEDIVFVVVLAGHREEAFQTVQDGINRLKAEVPLFKKEVTVSDEFWAHER